MKSKISYLIFILLVACSSSDDNENQIPEIKTGTFTDTRDGHIYKWVEIGGQVWMAENLAYLPKVSSPTSESSINQFFYVYGYSGTNVTEAKATENYKVFGALYNWSAAMNGAGSSINRVQGNCPQGWHLPDLGEWADLYDYLEKNHFGYKGNTIKTAKSLAGTILWNPSTEPGTPGNDLSSNNLSGFCGLPNGFCESPEFLGLGKWVHWWTATERTDGATWGWGLSFNSPYFSYFELFGKGSGYSVRCVKD